MQNNLKHLKLVFMTLIMGMAFTTANAQEGEITDEDLRKYAVVMDSIDAMKNNIQDNFNELIQSEELMDGGRRYVEIQGAAGDSIKLQELEITDEEMMAYNNIQADYEEMTAKFKENYTNLIKDELGGTLYNDITKALRSDAEVKARYDEILKEVKQSSDKGAETEAEVEG